MIEFFAAIIVIGLIYGVYALLKASGRATFLADYQFPEHVKKKLSEQYPELSNSDINTVFSALKDYFIIHKVEKKKGIAMPSKIVDDAWHEFILSTREYESFCKKGLGRFIHHIPSEAMHSENSAQDSLKRAWKYACRQQNIDPKKPDRLPPLFALDARFNVKNGFTYTLNKSAFDERIFNARHIQCMAAAAAGTSAGSGAAIFGASGGDSAGDGGGDGGGCSSGCGGGCSS
ncbi:hypothetical protein KFE96_04530 [Kordiimonas sp. SCSIO 12603]|uniref:glycine-rich domain-containing protein n=1 Tax=Kordiimonas sp. SCSIO 12603 TaxID=2829596 RepID=UPI002107A9D2|nr:hypothetical protein [Kordiimonas sp. SCSIO 12603]UTW59579.1 hypothetical protein KFE96_04530 [Kordiimonas sp. SCSIO 12603]